MFTAWQAWHVQGELRAAAQNLTAMSASAAEGNLKAAQRQVRGASENAASARRHTRGPVWWTASKLPEIGDEVTAVRTVAEVADSLAGDTLPPLLRAGSALTERAVSPRGKFVLEPIARAAPSLEVGAEQVAASARRVDALETDGLLWPIKPQVLDLRDKLDRARDLTSAASTAAKLVPPMLGQNDERTYLLKIQNNAEVRATGGLPGALAVVSVKDGKLELERTGAPRDIGYFETPFRGQSPEEEALFSSRAVQYSQDTGINPHFPWSAETLSRMWTERQDTKIDGVMAIDPVVFSYALDATGPLTAGGQELTSANAVDLLLRDVYIEEADLEAQNRFYEAVTRAFFVKIADGDFDPATLVGALGRGVEERRVMLWSDVEAEQDVLEPLRISGAVPDEPERSPEIGLYLNDSGSDKLTYYLEHTVEVASQSCGSLGNQVLDVTVELVSTVPAGVETSAVGGRAAESGASGGGHAPYHLPLRARRRQHRLASGRWRGDCLLRGKSPRARGGLAQPARTAGAEEDDRVHRLYRSRSDRQATSVDDPGRTLDRCREDWRIGVALTVARRYSWCASEMSADHRWRSACLPRGSIPV